MINCCFHGLKGTDIARHFWSAYSQRAISSSFGVNPGLESSRALKGARGFARRAKPTFNSPTNLHVHHRAACLRTAGSSMEVVCPVNCLNVPISNN